MVTFLISTWAFFADNAPFVAGSRRTIYILIKSDGSVHNNLTYDSFSNSSRLEILGKFINFNLMHLLFSYSLFQLETFFRKNYNLPDYKLIFNHPLIIPRESLTWKSNKSVASFQKSRRAGLFNRWIQIKYSGGTKRKFNR